MPSSPLSVSVSLAPLFIPQKENAMFKPSKPHFFYFSALILTLSLSGPSFASDWNWGSSKTLDGSGKIETRDFHVEKFNALAISVSGAIDIRQDGSEGLSIATDDNLLKEIEVEVVHGTLKIHPKNNVRLNSTGMHVVVHLKDLQSLSLAGFDKVHVDIASLNTARLHASMGGSGSINIQKLATQELKVDIGGSGNFSANGKAEIASYAIGGSGNVDTGALKSDTVTVSIGGSGKLVVAAKSKLNVSVGGSGEVQYYGDPHVSQASVGISNIKRIGE
jgi:hypothetical protein